MPRSARSLTQVIPLRSLPISDSAPLGIATLEFDRDKLIVGTDTDIRQGLSAVALHGQDLWLACDEGCRLERLSRTGSELSFSDHRVFPLESVLALPADPKEEADVEGMDIDGGWLWLVGSHSVKRKKPKKNDTRDDVAAKLATTQRDGNRHLLARIPLDQGVLQRAVGGRRAGSIATSTTSSALLDAIVEHDDPHLSPFIPLPGKDNGLDIEGLAVRDMRAFVGLRGPVLREWCCILELRLEADDEKLRLMPLNGAVPYRKHFLKLNGLGVRDLLVLGDDPFRLFWVCWPFRPACSRKRRPKSTRPCSPPRPICVRGRRSSSGSPTTPTRR